MPVLKTGHYVTLNIPHKSNIHIYPSHTPSNDEVQSMNFQVNRYDHIRKDMYIMYILREISQVLYSNLSIELVTIKVTLTSILQHLHVYNSTAA